MKEGCLGCGKCPRWQIMYDIGRNQTEQTLVCEDCYENPDDDSFRVYVISRKEIERGSK